MTTYLIHGCFDVLHRGHRDYINRAIASVDPGVESKVLLIVWSDDIVSTKGGDRPLFPQQWRLDDLKDKFESPSVTVLCLGWDWKEHPLIKDSLQNMVVLSPGDRDMSIYPGCPAHSFERKVTKLGIPIRFIEVNQDLDHIHTSSIVKRLSAEMDKSECSTVKVGAVLVRNGQVVASACNGGLAIESCPRCNWNVSKNAIGDRDSNKPPCLFPHAEEKLLPFMKKGDDLFVSRQPCPTCEVKLQQIGIRRVVYWEERQGNPPVGFNKAGIW